MSSYFLTYKAVEVEPIKLPFIYEIVECRKVGRKPPDEQVSSNQRLEMLFRIELDSRSLFLLALYLEILSLYLYLLLFAFVSDLSLFRDPLSIPTVENGTMAASPHLSCYISSLIALLTNIYTTIPADYSIILSPPILIVLYCLIRLSNARSHPIDSSPTHRLVDEFCDMGFEQLPETDFQEAFEETLQELPLAMGEFVPTFDYNLQRTLYSFDYTQGIDNSAVVFPHFDPDTTEFNSIQTSILPFSILNFPQNTLPGEDVQSPYPLYFSESPYYAEHRGPAPFEVVRTPSIPPLPSKIPFSPNQRTGPAKEQQVPLRPCHLNNFRSFLPEHSTTSLLPFSNTPGMENRQATDKGHIQLQNGVGFPFFHSQFLDPSMLLAEPSTSSPVPPELSSTIPASSSSRATPNPSPLTSPKKRKGNNAFGTKGVIKCQRCQNHHSRCVRNLVNPEGPCMRCRKGPWDCVRKRACEREREGRKRARVDA